MKKHLLFIGFLNFKYGIVLSLGFIFSIFLALKGWEFSLAWLDTTAGILIITLIIGAVIINIRAYRKYKHKINFTVINKIKWHLASLLGILASFIICQIIFGIGLVILSMFNIEI